jgi:hypothetical protein
MHIVPVTLYVAFQRSHYHRWIHDDLALNRLITSGDVPIHLQGIFKLVVTLFEKVSYSNMAGQRFFLLPEPSASSVLPLLSYSEQLAETVFTELTRRIENNDESARHTWSICLGIGRERMKPVVTTIICHSKVYQSPAGVDPAWD